LITIKNSEQIEQIKKAAIIAADTLSLLSSFIIPGKTGLEVDALAEEYIRDNGGTAACKGYENFPSSLCISVNANAVHCIPDNKPFLEGDIVKLDLVVDYNGWKADTAISVLILPVKPEVRKLAETTYTAMLRGIEQAKEGNTTQSISKAIYDARNEYGLECGVIREFTGHAIGRNIHESPSIPNVVIKEKNSLLVAGMVLCIEPIFCLGKPDIYYKKGEWNTWMLDGGWVSHFEHTILITKDKPEILTLREIEKMQ
jgi:methionyl aminopeptidase